jgi:hypothetical protein
MSTEEKKMDEALNDGVKNGKGPEKKGKKRVELVPLTLPLTRDPEIDSYPVPVGLNFKTYLIKRGETVMVPAEIKKMFEESEKAEDEAYRYSLSRSLSANEAEFKARYNL